MAKKFEEKLSHLSVSERKNLEKLIKKIPRFISLASYENVVAEWSFILLRERKEERNRGKRYFLPQSLILKKDYKTRQKCGERERN